MLQTSPRHRAAPETQAIYFPNGKRKCGLVPNVSGFRFRASAACSAPQWGSRVAQVGQAQPPPWLSLTQAADKQMRDCELTSVAPGRGVSDAIGTVLAKVPIIPLGTDVGISVPYLLDASSTPLL